MKIIGHRGAAGLALENTLEAIKAGIAAGADGVEVDVRRTKDSHLVLSHDTNLKRVSGHRLSVANHTLKQLQKVQLKNGERLATLEQAINVTKGNATLIVEGKGSGWSHILTAILEKNKAQKHVAVISFNYHELAIFHKFMPDVPVYALASVNSFKAIRAAKNNGFTGVDLGYWLVHPLTSWLARRAHLEIFTFTVNHFLLAKYLVKCHPGIAITTNYPNKLRSIK